MTEHYSFTVDRTKLRLDQYLVDQLPDLSRSKIQHYIKRGQVTIDGDTVKSSHILQGNEIIECHFTPKYQDDSIKGESMDLDIIYEDDAFAVINKPSGLVVHPGAGNRSGTLLNGLIYHFNKLSYAQTNRPGIVHRLDKDTSGLIIIAKNDNAHDKLSQQFNMRLVKKEYLALAWGQLDEDGLIQGNLSRHPKNRHLFTIIDNGGKDSLTNYSLNEYIAPLSFVKLYPKTGRTHQLRVHLKSIGHPIFGDIAYGGGEKYGKSFHIKYAQIIKRLFKVISRVALHAHKITICHPVTMQDIEFEAILPCDLQLGLEILKNG